MVTKLPVQICTHYFPALAFPCLILAFLARTLLDQVQSVYDEYQREALPALLAAARGQQDASGEPEVLQALVQKS